MSHGGLLDCDRWPEIQDEMIDAMIRFEAALRPYIESLKIQMRREPGSAAEVADAACDAGHRACRLVESGICFIRGGTWMVEDESDERWPSSDAESEPDPRTLRWRMTPAQKALWQALRRRQLSSYEFHRQRGSGRADVDFYCDERRLLVVVDAPDAADHHEQTVERDLARAREGIRVLHVSEKEVVDALYETLARVVAAAEAPLLPPPARDGQEH